MTDVLIQAQTNSPLYVAERAEKVRPAYDTFKAWADATARAGGETVQLPPIRISVAALQDLAAWLDS